MKKPAPNGAGRLSETTLPEKRYARPEQIPGAIFSGVQSGSCDAGKYADDSLNIGKSVHDSFL